MARGRPRTPCRRQRRSFGLGGRPRDNGMCHPALLTPPLGRAITRQASLTIPSGARSRRLVVLFAGYDLRTGSYLHRWSLGKAMR